MNDETARRFFEKVRINDAGCWVWQAATRRGYGAFWQASPSEAARGRHHPAHRYAYELLVGPIPEGLTVDHLCRNRACVNPEHLEPVSHRTNILRGEGPTARHAVQTRCVHGHEFTPGNTRIDRRGGRECRECGKRRQREYMARLRAVEAQVSV